MSDESIRELAPGLWCTSQKVGGRVHAFLFDDGDELTLFDTLYDTKPTRILALIERAGRKPAELKHIILSHAHRSHLGAAAALRDLTGATVYAHEWESDIIRGERKAQGVGLFPRRPYKVYIPFQLGISLGLGKHPPCPVDQFVAGGDRVGPVEIIEAGGHSPGHIGCLWADRRALVAGDAVATWPALMPGWPSFTLNDRQHRESLHRLAEVEPDVLGVGHGAPITTGARECIRDLIDALGPGR